jgi:hypothetical protein
VQKPRKLKWTERQELDDMESRILAAEAKVVELEARFAEPALFSMRGQDWQTVDAELRAAREKVSGLYRRWEELERIEAD